MGYFRDWNYVRQSLELVHFLLHRMMGRGREWKI